jgi:hypothetical protein
MSIFVQDSWTKSKPGKRGWAGNKPNEIKIGSEPLEDERRSKII